MSKSATRGLSSPPEVFRSLRQGMKDTRSPSATRLMPPLATDLPLCPIATTPSAVLLGTDGRGLAPAQTGGRCRVFLCSAIRAPDHYPENLAKRGFCAPRGGAKMTSAKPWTPTSRAMSMPPVTSTLPPLAGEGVNRPPEPRRRARPTPRCRTRTRLRSRGAWWWTTQRLTPWRSSTPSSTRT